MRRPWPTGGCRDKNKQINRVSHLKIGMGLFSNFLFRKYLTKISLWSRTLSEKVIDTKLLKEFLSV